MIPGSSQSLRLTCVLTWRQVVADRCGVLLTGARPPHDHLHVSVRRNRGDEAVAVAFSMALLPAAARADALFELTDAVLCAGGPVCSLPRLSLEPVMRRGHGSGYAALAKGRADAAGLGGLLAAHPPADWPLVFAVDATTWPRAAAETS